jgi:hypothetical protein
MERKAKMENVRYWLRKSYEEYESVTQNTDRATSSGSSQAGSRVLGLERGGDSLN